MPPGRARSSKWPWPSAVDRGSRDARHGTGYVGTSPSLCCTLLYPTAVPSAGVNSPTPRGALLGCYPRLPSWLTVTGRRGVNLAPQRRWQREYGRYVAGPTRIPDGRTLTLLRHERPPRRRLPDCPAEAAAHL